MLGTIQKWTVMTGLLAMSACTTLPGPQIATSRSDNAALMFAAAPVSSDAMNAQVRDLNKAASGLVRSTVVKSALKGAALSCGLALVSGSQAKKCVAQAAVGGAIGAAVGKASGERDVKRRIALISPSEVASDIRSANIELDRVELGLPQLLAQQDAELHKARLQLATGHIDQVEFDRIKTGVSDERAFLAETLEMSARDARRAMQNLQGAVSRGQTGLGDHILATERLSDAIISSRASIDLL